jgi:hypothetical protein
MGARGRTDQRDIGSASAFFLGSFSVQVKKREEGANFFQHAVRLIARISSARAFILLNVVAVAPRF